MLAILYTTVIATLFHDVVAKPPPCGLPQIVDYDTMDNPKFKLARFEWTCNGKTRNRIFGAATSKLSKQTPATEIARGWMSCLQSYNLKECPMINVYKHGGYHFGFNSKAGYDKVCAIDIKEYCAERKMAKMEVTRDIKWIAGIMDYGHRDWRIEISYPMNKLRAVAATVVVPKGVVTKPKHQASQSIVVQPQHHASQSVVISPEQQRALVTTKKHHKARVRYDNEYNDEYQDYYGYGGIYGGIYGGNDEDEWDHDEYIAGFKAGYIAAKQEEIRVLLKKRKRARNYHN